MTAAEMAVITDSANAEHRRPLECVVSSEIVGNDERDRYFYCCYVDTRSGVQMICKLLLPKAAA